MSKNPPPAVTSFFTLGFLRLFLPVGLVLALLNSFYSVALVLVFLVITLEGARLWSRAGLRRLAERRELSCQRVFPEEETILKIQFDNNKLLPVLLGWEQSFGNGLECVSTGNASAEKTALEKTVIDSAGAEVFLGGRSCYTARLTLRPRARGYYQLPALRVTARDGLGLFYREELREDPCTLLVYPRLLELTELPLRPADIIGDREDKRHLLPDPTRTIGLRDYTPEIPSRLIHWKASAHQNKLMAKVLEPTANLRICLAFDVEPFLTPDPDRDGYEYALSYLASLVVWADQERIPCGLLANGRQSGLDRAVAIPVTRSKHRTVRALEALARLEYAPCGTLAELLEEEGAYLPWGTTLVLVGESQAVAFPPAVRKVVRYPLARPVRKEVENGDA